MIDCKTGAIKNLNIVSLSNKALVELKGDQNLFEPHFFKRGREIEIERTETSKEHYYLPRLDFFLKNGCRVTARIFTDLKEKGFVYSFEGTEEIEVDLLFDLRSVSLLRFNSHTINFKKKLTKDEWLRTTICHIVSSKLSLALGFGGNNNCKISIFEEKIKLQLNLPRYEKNCFYISINYDQDGASSTLIHLKRKGCKRIYLEFIDWLKQKIIFYSRDRLLETRLNENMFFNYFYAIARDMESDKYLALTSRSPRYYVSGAFWERDCFLWSLPAVKLVNPQLYQHMVREMILLHSGNPGDHAHYIDGTVLYPGFELDEAASYFLLLGSLNDSVIDERLTCTFAKVFERIECEYDSKTGLYRTFLLPSDDPAEFPFVLIDNVILWRGFHNYRHFLLKKGQIEKAELLKDRIEGIYGGIYRFLVGKIEGKDMFLWSADGKGKFRIYNDSAGNLGTLCYYNFVSKDEPVFENTINYYYSSRYQYFFKNAIINELACDHHPHTPSGLGLCGSILNPLLKERALEWLKKAEMDHGLLSESFDKNSGEAKTGVGFASGCGYLAYSLYHSLVKENKK